MKTILIGADNAATELKKHIISILEKKNIPYEDMGVQEGSDEIYPNVAERVAKGIIESNYEKEGILICGTGIGMAITANKFPGIYAAVCHDILSTERARLSNNTNVITMGARIIAPELATKMIETWLSLEFIDGSSTEKVNRIKELEKEVYHQSKCM
jgi:ribose 5-phosphate isomerase B